jgi:hypothetical protein
MATTESDPDATRSPLLLGIIPWLVVALTGLTFVLRTWQLDAVPPWLWWDEATQGLDARELLNGHFRVFYPSAMGKEPLYIYLTTPFVAAWDGQPFAVRLAGGVLGALMIPTLCAAGRALWPARATLGLWTGLLGASLWAVNFWPQSINRIGFQVNPFPLVLTLAVVSWLNYTRRPDGRRAAVFGLLAGLTLTTYLVARVTPLLWLLLYAALPRSGRRVLRPTLPWALALGCLVAAPLAIHYALHPGDFLQRLGGLETLQSDVQEVTLDKFWLSLRQLIGGFVGLYGDPIVRHNLPDRPPFSLVAGALFACGAALALVAAIVRRDQGASTLLLWWLIPCLPFLASVTNAPHFPRLFGALPPALLLVALPVGWLAERLQRRGRKSLHLALGGATALWLAVEAGLMAQAYFVAWPRQAEMAAAFQGDTWRFGQRVAESAAQTPGTAGIAPLEPGYGAQLDYLLPDAPILQLPAGHGDVGSWLATHLDQPAGKSVLTPVWTQGANLAADARRALPFFLEREGTLVTEQSLPGFDLLTFQLGERPQFDAAGQAMRSDSPFPPDLRLIEARWGAAHPNPDRSGTTVAAGTPLWAILSWQLDRPLPDARISVDLMDAAGRRLASSEMSLMDARQQNATSWPTGARLDTYHLIDTPATQPPGPVRLAVRVYDARTLEPLLAGEDDKTLGVALGEARVTPPLAPVDPAALAIARPLSHMFASGIQLIGADAWPAVVNAGQTLPIKLYWQALGPSTASRSFTLGLRSAGGGVGVRTEIVAPATTPRQIVHTHADLRLPADLPAGDYELYLASPGDSTPVPVGPVAVANRPRQFVTPSTEVSQDGAFGNVIQLIGLDAPSAGLPVTAGQTVTVTLVWRVLNTPSRELVRFLHMLGPDGRPVAQEDRPPCDGACAAPSWLPGEIVVDQARLAIPSGLPPGDYPLAVGWYDPATFRRLPAEGSGAAGPATAADALPLVISVVVTH